jgi:hypothetical protein
MVGQENAEGDRATAGGVSAGVSEHRCGYPGGLQNPAIGVSWPGWLEGMPLPLLPLHCLAGRVTLDAA